VTKPKAKTKVKNKTNTKTSRAPGLRRIDEDPRRSGTWMDKYSRMPFFTEPSWLVRRVATDMQDMPPTPWLQALLEAEHFQNTAPLLQLLRSGEDTPPIRYYVADMIEHHNTKQKAELLTELCAGTSGALRRVADVLELAGLRRKRGGQRTPSAYGPGYVLRVSDRVRQIEAAVDLAKSLKRLGALPREKVIQLLDGYGWEEVSRVLGAPSREGAIERLGALSRKEAIRLAASYARINERVVENAYSGKLGNLRRSRKNEIGRPR
jgi:hypothetical protein